MLLQLLASELKAKVEDIHDFELCLFDTQGSVRRPWIGVTADSRIQCHSASHPAPLPQVIGGLNDEFIFSPRLDNLESSYCALQALIESLKDEDNFKSDTTGRVIALFDHEEVRCTVMAA